MTRGLTLAFDTATDVATCALLDGDSVLGERSTVARALLEEVDALLGAKQGTTLVVVNSICGCAAGHARPGVMEALQNARIPDRSVTVFAGVDRDAVERAREFMAPYPPSSPSIGLFKDGKQVLMLQRSDIQAMRS